ncbi:outer membrane beta-barrel family protein [Segetibacter aerophilus]|uniref:TonB-dependent receptor n=1 Tax=Segetibacter aerophilus TaxID=670293 RepID=A0A512BHZ5_9BACT|nr:outer membrane beta-barrel family protein [Segetibacter aerophilus]GEO11571.1 TonB-dependent receptor [Segetibacter aerophilus]
MKRLTAYLTALLLLVSSFAKSQENASPAAAKVAALSGIVTGENNKALTYATISLLTVKDSSLIKTTMTDSTGTYRFNNITPGAYFISVSMTGYRAGKSNTITIGAGVSKVQAPSLKLEIESKSLAAVVVTAKKSFIERKIDRTIVNVENSAISAGSTALEVLEKAPGVIVDKDGNISMSGKSGVMVMIDGKQTYMSHSEVAQLLRSMQSSQVESIELITNPSAKYDAAGNAGIINIKTKKSKTVGTNGAANIGMGYGNRYKTNAGINLNHRNEKMNIFANYNHGVNHTDRVLDISRVNRLNNQNTYFTQREADDRNYQSNNYKAGVDFFLNSKNTLGFLISGYANNSSSNSNNVTNIGASQKVSDSLINVAGRSNGRYRNMAYNINYKVILDTTGKELAIDADCSRNHSRDFNSYDNFFLSKDGSQFRDPYLNRNTTPSLINIKSIKADYVWPVSKSLKVEAGVKSSLVRTDNDLQFEEMENNNWKNNSNRSNHFIYDETIHAGYVNGSKQFKNTSIQIGLRAEKTISKGNSITENKVVERSYFDLFPSLFVNQTISNNHSTSFSYSRRIDRPSYDALNPFVYYLDQYTFQKGNPFLNPQYTHSFEVGYLYKKKYSANFRYAVTKDNITDVILPDTARKGLYQTSANVNDAKFLSLTLNAPVAITKWWNTNNTVTVFNNQYQATGLEGLNLDVNKSSFYLNTNHNFTLSQTFTAEAGANYTSSNVYGTFNFGSSYSVDLGLSKTLMNKKASVKFSVNDVFNTRATNIHSSLSSVNYKLYQKAETRVFRLTFSYRFGSSAIKEARHRSTGLESEQSRVKQ